MWRSIRNLLYSSNAIVANLKWSITIPLWTRLNPYVSDHCFRKGIVFTQGPWLRSAATLISLLPLRSFLKPVKLLKKWQAANIIISTADEQLTIFRLYHSEPDQDTQQNESRQEPIVQYERDVKPQWEPYWHRCFFLFSPPSYVPVTSRWLSWTPFFFVHLTPKVALYNFPNATPSSFNKSYVVVERWCVALFWAFWRRESYLYFSSHLFGLTALPCKKSTPLRWDLPQEAPLSPSARDTYLLFYNTQDASSSLSLRHFEESWIPWSIFTR